MDGEKRAGEVERLGGSFWDPLMLFSKGLLIFLFAGGWLPRLYVETYCSRGWDPLFNC